MVAPTPPSGEYRPDGRISQAEYNVGKTKAVDPNVQSGSFVLTAILPPETRTKDIYAQRTNVAVWGATDLEGGHKRLVLLEHTTAPGDDNGLVLYARAGSLILFGDDGQEAGYLSPSPDQAGGAESPNRQISYTPPDLHSTNPYIGMPR